MTFENGKKISDAYVEIDGVKHPVVMPTYDGNTPISAYNLNKMQEELKFGVNKNTTISDCNGLYNFGIYKISSTCENCPADVDPAATQQDGNICFLISIHDDSGMYEPWIQIFIDVKNWSIYMRSTTGNFTGDYNPWMKISADIVSIK